MSDARDNMMALVARVSAGLEPEWCDKVRDNMDAFAHELAEKIRAERHNRYATGLEEEFWPADLIDPEVSDD
jgi:hypothetical protein